MLYGKTITTYLIDGSPTGVKTVELSNWVGKAIVIPRTKLKDIKQREEVLQPSIYFLFGIDKNGNNLAYIGEAENLINRIGNHDLNKKFWEIAIGFISKDNNLTKADVKYLEAKVIEKAKKLNRYILKNGLEPIPNNLPEYQLSTMNEFLDNINLLISALGYPIIKEIGNKNVKDIKNNNLFYLKIRGCNALGLYTDDGFVVLKGSKCSNDEVESFIKNYKEKRKKLIEQEIIKNDKKDFILQQDYIFTSPSPAASILSGRTANGWKEWKNKEGKTLDEIERKNFNNN